MMFDPAGASRVQAMGLLASELEKPQSLAGLAAIGRALASRLPRLEVAPAGPPPGFRERVIRSAPPPSAAALASRSAVRAMILLLDVCAAGEASGLARMLDEVLPLPDAAPILASLTHFLDATGLARDLPAEQVEALGRRIPETPTVPLLAALGLLGLSPAAPNAARRTAFYGAAAPHLRRAAQADDVDALLAIERLVYDAYLKRVETPEHHTETLREIEAAYALLPARDRPAPAAHAGPPRVAFLIPNGVMLAHTEVLVSFLSGLARQPDPILEPVVFIYSAKDGGPLGGRLDELGVRWEALGQANHPPDGARFDRLRERLAAAGADAAVFVSLPLHIAYACRRPLAPVQIWWSMKFPLPNFPELDGRVFYRSLLDRKIVIEGREWRGGPMAITPPPPADPQAAQAIRARFPGKTLLGTIAREEKIADPEFLAAVTDVLRRHPETCFLWTGRTRLAQVQAAFDRAGVAERCHFVGWVDPAPYIMAFDLFLETYPLTGVMCAWAMAWGQPLVSVGSLGFVATYLEPVLNGAIEADPQELARIEAVFAPIRGRLPGLWAAGPEQIGAFVEVLLADPELRRTLGQVQRRYVETFLSGEAASAVVQARHFADIVQETTAAVSAGARAPRR